VRLTKKGVQDAMALFDQQYRDKGRWKNWEQKKNFGYAIVDGETRYPIKEIISLATGRPVGEFHGGKHFANDKIEKLGFQLMSLRDLRRGSSPSKSSSIRNRIIFSRIGWMKFYAGTQIGDEKPTGGGKYNLHKAGHERFNFLNIDDRLYGYVQPPGPAINLARIDSLSDDGQLNGVTVVFIAKNVIVGWYRNAVVHGKEQWLSAPAQRRRADCGFYFEAKAVDCVLLPTTQRTFAIPTGRNGMGQANVGYALDVSRKPRPPSWIKNAQTWMQNYDGANLLLNPEIETQQAIVDIADQTASAAQGQGFIQNQAVKEAVEELAMAQAERFFRNEGFRVSRKGKPYDLYCTKDGKQLFIEVKGTQSIGQEVFLTGGEVRFAREHSCEMVLFVLHSIKVVQRRQNWTARGGVERLYRPWTIDAQALTPMAFSYRLPA
jgi:hypothetical protein